MRKVVGGIGRALITIGLLILGFLAYQLWGTGIYTAREQSSLKANFRVELEVAATTTTTQGKPPPTPAPPQGQPLAVIQIPKIGLEAIVVEGVTVADLRKGPGHYPETPLPGQIGNAAIAGHRTTYGAPFHRIDELLVGDSIVVRTIDGNYTYKVTEQLIVDRRDVHVLIPTTKAELTLTSCHPKFSASQRMIVKAVLEEELSAEPTVSTVKNDSKADFQSGIAEHKPGTGPLFVWLFAAAVVGVLWWLAFRRWRRWTTWVAGAIPFTIVLCGVYFHIERLLPTSY